MPPAALAARGPSAPAAGRTSVFTAAGASMPPAALAARGPSAPAAGRTSGRPCSCAERRAACVPMNRTAALLTADGAALPMHRSGGHPARRMPVGVASGFGGPQARGYFRLWSARGCPCQSSGVGNRAQQGLRSEVSSERPEARDGRRERPARWHGQPRARPPRLPGHKNRERRASTSEVALATPKQSASQIFFRSRFGCGGASIRFLSSP
jgi:hypothetical protein